MTPPRFRTRAGSLYWALWRLVRYCPRVRPNLLRLDGDGVLTGPRAVEAYVADGRAAPEVWAALGRVPATLTEVEKELVRVVESVLRSAPGDGYNYIQTLGHLDAADVIRVIRALKRRA